MNETFGPFEDVFNHTNSSMNSSFMNSSSIDNIDDFEYKTPYIIILAFSPLILVVISLICICLANAIYEVKKKFKNIIKKINKYTEKNNLPIKNNILNKSFIDTLNKSNNCEFDKSCSICVENIEDKEFKKKRHIVTLNCKHSFHTSCINEWVKTQTSIGTKPVCPTCRMDIVNINECKNNYTIININYESDSSDTSYVTSLSDL